MLFQINPSFTKKNQLKLNLSKNLVNQNYKLCFSLVYSIQSIEGGEIVKQTGRYYELTIHNNTVLIDLQKPRIGSYNMSCGPEGTFIIDNKNKHIKVEVTDLKFENEIAEVIYDQSTINNFIPIVPEPTNFIFKKDYVEIKNKTFKLINDNDIIKNTSQFTDKLGIIFSIDNGFPIYFIENNYEEDEYSLDISKDKIQILHKNYGGKLYGLITLIQLIDFYKNKLPIGKIDDKPKYSWRGMHLDCARQFYTTDEIKRILDYMALFKINRFHWHLTDNEAWRIELKCYPNLTRSASYRGYNMAVPPFYGSGYEKYGGFYSHGDIKNLISYAKNLNIEVMPEIDLPAHSWALLQVMPELRDEKTNIISEDVGSYKNNTIDPSLEETKKFLNSMLDEISEIFSFNVIHVGLDERPDNSWEGSQSIKEFMNKNNIKSQAEYQDYYMNYLIAVIKSKNKRTAAWNEAAITPHIDHGVGGSAGNLDKSCLIFSWEHSDVAKETTSKKFETILCPGQKTYFDMAYNNSTNERGICWAATIEVKDIFNWDPADNIENKNYIKGIQGQLWSETITEKKFIDKMINPRLATLSEIAWRGKISRNWIHFRSTLLNTVKFLEKLGWSHHKF